MKSSKPVKGLTPLYVLRDSTQFPFTIVKSYRQTEMFRHSKENLLEKQESLDNFSERSTSPSLSAKKATKPKRRTISVMRPVEVADRRRRKKATVVKKRKYVGNCAIAVL
mmetsp:Transcript_26294/g.47120  ORF Transcript_26294/g.47120 Transcript_26294/m.47120 type:complete len:110 (+) Transcript_26294:103-432(+)